MRVWALVLALGLMAVTAAADEILLRNGNIIRGDIILETQTTVKINVRMDGPDAQSIEMTIPRERIRSVRKSASLFRSGETRAVLPTPGEAEAERAGEPGQTPPVIQPPPAQPETGAPAVPPAAAASEPLKPVTENGTGEAADEEEAIDPALQRQIDLLVQNLAHLEDPVRDAAKQRLAAMGEPAIPSLARVLTGAAQSQRQVLGAIDVLGDMRAKPVVLLMIDQMKGGRDNRNRQRLAYVAVKKITGQAIYYNEDWTPARREQQINEWLRWFETVEAQFPAQIGYETRKETLDKGETPPPLAPPKT